MKLAKKFPTTSWAFCLRSGIFPDSGGFTEFAVKIPPDQGEIIQSNT